MNALRLAFLGIAAVVLQWLFFGRLLMWGAYPDVVLIYVVWMGIRFGRASGLMAGSASGLLMDAIYGTWGVHMFVKSLIGFVIGLFAPGERVAVLFSTRRAFVGILMTALIHNGLLVIFIVLESGTRTLSLLTVQLLGSALYTGFVGALAVLYATRR